MTRKTITTLAALASLALPAAACGGSGHQAQPLTSPPPSSQQSGGQVHIDKHPATAQGGPQAKEAPGVFLARLIQTQLLGQYERSYAWLDPSEQAKVDRDAFVGYFQQRDDAIAGVSLKSAKVTDHYPVVSQGLHEQAVTLAVTLAKDGQASTQTWTLHAVDRGDHWTWLLDQDAQQALLR